MRNSMNLFNKNKNKVKKSKKSIIINKTIIVSIEFFILAFFCYTIYNKLVVIITKENINMVNIKNKISLLNSEIHEIDRKASMMQNYINTWNNSISNMQKEKDGINIANVEKIIKEIAKKNYINTIDISFSKPIKIKNHDLKIIGVTNSEIIITFNCLTEHMIYHLLNDLKAGKYAFFIVENLEIRRIRNIDKDTIKTIIEIGNTELLSVTIKLQWYEFSNK